MLVAHNRYVSVFNLTKEKWTKHYKMSDIVLQIFRNRKIDMVDEVDHDFDYDIGVLIGRQTIQFFDFLDMGGLEYEGDKNQIVLDNPVEQFLVD